MLLITDGLPRGLGYVEVDHRGTDAPVSEIPNGTRHFEADTYTCSHCQTVVVMNPMRVRERTKCNGCSHHICDPCAALKALGQPCKTFWQQVDEVMEQAARRPGSIISP